MSTKHRNQLLDRASKLSVRATVIWALGTICSVGLAHAADNGVDSTIDQAAAPHGSEGAQSRRRSEAQLGQSRSRYDELFETELREYCIHVTSVAVTESASLRYPWLFVDAGVIPVHSLEPSTAADTPRSTYTRLRAGIGFSPTRYWRGTLTGDRARADCERFRAERSLQREATRKEDVSGQLAGWTAKLKVIEGALPKARELLERVRADAAIGRATVLEVDEVELKLNQLRELGADARTRLAELGEAPTAPSLDLTKLGRDRISAEGEVERVESQLRRSSAFDVTVTGGLDRFFGANQRVPLFGMLAVTFNPAWFVTKDSEAKAATARASHVAAVAQQMTSDRVERTERLRAVVASQQAWLQQTAAFRAELEGRLARVATIEGAKSRTYTDQIWFEVVRLRAEEAYLSGNLRALMRILGLGTTQESAP